MAKVIEENGFYVLREEWTLDDVYSQAETMRVEITYDQAVSVLHEIAHYHDANIGINWLVIESAIDSVLNEVKV